MKKGWATVAVLILGVCAGAAAMGQNAPGRVPYDGSDAQNGPKPIHVDQKCRILPGSEGIPMKKAKPYNDSTICALEAESQSQHWEEKINGRELDRWLVRVKEQTFVLEDIADEPVMFIVQYDVPQGWFVDSDPQPWQMVGQTAYFHAYVKPGETVKLHVGVRRVWPQKPKPI
jgi:hypothetical protein